MATDNKLCLSYWQTAFVVVVAVVPLNCLKALATIHLADPAGHFECSRLANHFSVLVTIREEGRRGSSMSGNAQINRMADDFQQTNG